MIDEKPVEHKYKPFWETEKVDASIPVENVPNKIVAEDQEQEITENNGVRERKAKFKKKIETTPDDIIDSYKSESTFDSSNIAGVFFAIILIGVIIGVGWLVLSTALNNSPQLTVTNNNSTTSNNSINQIISPLVNWASNNPIMLIIIIAFPIVVLSRSKGRAIIGLVPAIIFIVAIYPTIRDQLHLSPMWALMGLPLLLIPIFVASRRSWIV